jgi:hypothetical protein
MHGQLTFVKVVDYMQCELLLFRIHGDILNESLQTDEVFIFNCRDLRVSLRTRT